MEPASKKVKITDHFRVALKPHNINNQLAQKKAKKYQDGGKENIVVITIDDEEEEKQQLRKLNRIENKSLSQKQPQQILHANRYFTPLDIKPTVVDHDRNLVGDIYCEPHYAWDSFNYDREQELKFKNRRYLDDEIHVGSITPRIRARFIDWLVELGDEFRLYHESLYMAVKMADQYLMRKTVAREQLRLLYLTSIFVAVKFDERLPPLGISELLQVSEHKYKREQIIRFELDLLITLDFNIRYPLSYGFLRRFARCTGSGQITLTLARYILESSLLEDQMIDILESKMAAASLLLAFRMLKKDWDDTAEFYTGYKERELTDLTKKLNEMISRPVDRRLPQIRKKYSDPIFLSVARIPPLATSF